METQEYHQKREHLLPHGPLQMLPTWLNTEQPGNL